MSDAATGMAPAQSRMPVVLGLVLLAAAVLVQVWTGPRDGSPWRRMWFDTLQQAMPRERAEMPAVVVEIDDQSLSRIGQWPWPRHFVGELIRRIHAAGATTIVKSSRQVWHSSS